MVGFTCSTFLVINLSKGFMNDKYPSVFIKEFFMARKGLVFDARRIYFYYRLRDAACPDIAINFPVTGFLLPKGYVRSFICLFAFAV
jgi:hypothetical protein